MRKITLAWGSSCDVEVRLYASLKSLNMAMRRVKWFRGLAIAGGVKHLVVHDLKTYRYRHLVLVVLSEEDYTYYTVGHEVMHASLAVFKRMPKNWLKVKRYEERFATLNGAMLEHIVSKFGPLKMERSKERLVKHEAA